MAISLGDAALAFAGGAAAEYNQQEAEKRQSAIRMEERNRELAEMHQYRVAETRGARLLEEEITRDQTVRQIQAMGGPESVDAKIYVATRVFGDKATALARMNQGWEPDMSAYTRPVNVEGTINDLQAAAGNDSRSRRRFRTIGETARTYVNTDPSTVPATEVPTTPSEGISDVYSAYVPPAQPGLEKSGDRLIQTNIDPVTGNIVTRVAYEPPEASGFVPLSTEGKRSTDLAVLREMQAADPENPFLISALSTMEKLLQDNDDPNLSIQKGTLEEDGIRYDVAQAVRVDPEMGVVAIGDALKLGVADAPGGGSTTFGQRQLLDLDAQTRGIAAAKQLISERMAMLAPGQEGTARGLTILTNSLVNQVTGLAELAGVPRETSADRLQEMYADLGMDMSEVVAELRESNSFLVGQSDMNLGKLVYSLGGILKETGTRRETSVADINNAKDLVKRIGSTNGGLGAATYLMHSLDVRAAGNSQLIYQNPNASAEKRGEAGTRLALINRPDLDVEANILADNVTGTIYFTSSLEEKEQIQQTVLEMQQGPNPPRSLEDAISRLPPNLRPYSLEEEIQLNAPDGYLFPEYDEATYLEDFMNRRR